MNKYIKASKNRVFDLKMQKNVFYYWFKYHQLFFHSLIWRGRKLFAFNFFIKIKQELKLREEADPALVLFVALLKITPEVIMFPYRRAGVVHMVPMPITIKKQITYSIKWVIKLLKDSQRRVNLTALVDLLIDSVYEKGPAVEKKNAIHEVAAKNKYLVRYFS